MRQTLLGLVFITGLAVLTLLGIFILNSSETQTEVQYTYPTSGEYTSYEVNHIVKGYEGSVTEIIDYTMSDEKKQALFDEYRQRENAAAEYEEARAIAESDISGQSFTEAEEVRIEAYCNENGFESCYNIQYTCDDEYTCYLVSSTCEEYDYDPYKEMKWGQKWACDSWDVTVDTDSFDMINVDESYWENYGWQW